MRPIDPNRFGNSVLTMLMVMFILVVIASCVTGCSTVRTLDTQTVEARAALHAAMIRQAQEELREAEDWRRLAIEAEIAVGSGK